MNLLLDPAKESLRKDKLESARKNYQENFGQVDLQKAYQSLFEILWYSQLPCFDVKNITSDAPDQMSIIKRCYWKGQEISCPIIFETLPTDRGMCCTFNMEKAEKMFKNSSYSRAISRMQASDKNQTFFNTTKPKFYENQPKSQAGLNKGLRLILDAHSDQISAGTVFDNFKGFVTLVGDRSSFPLTQRHSFLLRPGQQSYVAISATSVTSDQGIKDIDPKKRLCYFQDEHPLKLYKHYSLANCLFECQSDYARSQMESKCTPWYYPGN